mgnify:CR=1 FL=1
MKPNRKIWGMLALVGLVRGRTALTEAQKPLRAALLASMLLFASGGMIGVFIAGSNVRIPAHYHGCIVGVTLALMGLVYHLLPRLGYRAPEGRLATLQPTLYGAGQLMHILGLVWSGGYGVQRKVAGAEQVLRSPGEVAGAAASTAPRRASNAARPSNPTIGLSALTYAEYLRDHVAKEVLFLMDNAFRFVQAGSELSGLLGRMPATVGYQPTNPPFVIDLPEDRSKPAVVIAGGCEDVAVWRELAEVKASLGEEDEAADCLQLALLHAGPPYDAEDAGRLVALLRGPALASDDVLTELVVADRRSPADSGRLAALLVLRLAAGRPPPDEVMQLALPVFLDPRLPVPRRLALIRGGFQTVAPVTPSASLATPAPCRALQTNGAPNQSC